ncbi:unnamed protein product, partial [Rotaria sp. Silwood1]
KPLGFNVQGDWEMSGVNEAMRLNKYRHDEYFAPHKDAQYAPNGDERSLLSLVIYLNDNYEKGETKFYFPKAAPKFNTKGLTIEEEIQAYSGLENGYECVTIKPKKGYAVLFTHNLLHAAMAPHMENSLNVTERIVLRTDVLVQRIGKPLGFAICPEEQEDYLACLNFFREAQQNELKLYKNFDYSVDRTYMTNRHQSQFIGQDFLSRFHFEMHISDSSNSERSDSYASDELDKSDILTYQRNHALYDRENRLVDQYSAIEDDIYTWMDMTACSKDDMMGYCENLLKQTQQNSGTSLLRILLAKDHVIDKICSCSLGSRPSMDEVKDLIVCYNHLIFDFDTHRLTVEQLPDGKLNTTDRDSLLYNCIRTLQRSVARENPITWYRVNIEKLAQATQGFNHASCQCSYPEVKIDQFSFLDYTYLSHVHLAVGRNKNHVFVLATYGGVAAL